MTDNEMKIKSEGTSARCFWGSSVAHIPTKDYREKILADPSRTKIPLFHSTPQSPNPYWDLLND